MTESVFSQVVFPWFGFLSPAAAAAAAVLLENDTISLNCDQLIDDQTKCDATTWVFYRSIKTPVELITLGQITSTRLDVNKVHRLKVLENCSLEIKSVTAEDAGRYHCQQYRSGKKEGQDTVVELAVVTSESFSPQKLVDHSVRQLSMISIALVVTDDV